MDAIEKAQKDLANIMEKEVFVVLSEKAVPEFIKHIQEVFDYTLGDIVVDPHSKTRPELYRESFVARLNEFNFVETQGGRVSFNIPDMETFDFSGKLRILQTILEGIVGQYVEMSGDEYKKVFGKKKIEMEPLDSNLPDSERVYLVKYSNFIQKKETELKKRFVRYPFSNMPPVDLFDESSDFAKINIDKWIQEATKKAVDKYANSKKGIA